jgi:hypothetical protein
MLRQPAELLTRALFGAQTKKDALYQWKALRMIARTSLPVFSKMLGPVPSKARKGKDADKKEAASEVRAKLDLEDAVHELLPVR